MATLGRGRCGTSSSGPGSPGGTPAPEAWHEVENFLTTFPILYPNDNVVRAAVRGASLHRLPWFDAHLWAYAEAFDLEEILSEDFQHGRRYGAVRVTNPFLAA